MERGTITIENDTVIVKPAPDGSVWLTQSEIARLFDVFVAAVSANIRAIYKSGALKDYETQWNRSTPNGGFTELYNMEMIAALAFRVRSHNSQVFRRWLTHRPQPKTVLIRIPEEGRTMLN